MVCNVRRIPAHTSNVLRRERIQEVHADEVQARLGWHDAALLEGLSVVFEDGKIDPTEVRLETGAPDHIRHVQRTPVFEYGQPVADSDHLRHALDSGSGQVHLDLTRMSGAPFSRT